MMINVSKYMDIFFAAVGGLRWKTLRSMEVEIGTAKPLRMLPQKFDTAAAFGIKGAQPIRLRPSSFNIHLANLIYQGNT